MFGEGQATRALCMALEYYLWIRSELHALFQGADPNMAANK
jgi:hypothetical protein